MAMQKGELGNKAIDAIIALNKRNIARALEDYKRHIAPEDYNAVGHVSEAFIERLAIDSAIAKTPLRSVLSKCWGWNAELQAVVGDAKYLHAPDWSLVKRYAWEIVTPYKTGALSDMEYHDFCAAMEFFTRPESVIDVTRSIAAIKKIAPRAYRKNRKVNRIFQDFCKAIGVYDGAAASEYQRLFAKYSDEINGKEIKVTVYISINPAHIVTASNPKYDARGECMTSCHSWNHPDYAYGVGNSGYARDEVTMIVFIANPADPESLNNRKEARQFFFYKVNDGTLVESGSTVYSGKFPLGTCVQSRLYSTWGGVNGSSELADLFRDIVQRVISEGERAVNLWTTKNLDKSNLYFPKARGFGGYADWLEFSGATIRLSTRNDCEGRHSGFEIGAPGLCVSCGEEIFAEDSLSYYCDACDPDRRSYCDHCGCRITGDEEILVQGPDGYEVAVCEDCLSDYYRLCECCDEYHPVDNCELTDSGRYACRECLERHYFQCDECGTWTHEDSAHYGIHGGEEVAVCSDCFHDVYNQCVKCGEFFHNDDVSYSTGACICDSCREEEEELTE